MVLSVLAYAHYVPGVGRILHGTCKQYRGFLSEYERIVFIVGVRKIKQEITSLVSLLQPQFLYMQAQTIVTIVWI